MTSPRSTEPVPITRLELSTLGPGRHDLLLHLADDGLGFPCHVPLIVVRGRQEGPTFGLVAGLHGNELNGIWVIHEVMEGLSAGRVRGTVVAAVVANAPGLVRRERGFSDGHDLNRAFPGKARGAPSQVWAHRLRSQIASKFDVLLDLHTAGQGRRNCVYARVDLEVPQARDLARVLRPQLIVHKPPSDRSLREWASSRGIPAVTLEIGDPQRRQGEMSSKTALGVRRALRWAGVLAGATPSAKPLRTEFRRSRWLYTTRGGLLQVFVPVGGRVAKGTTIAVLLDAFGREVESYAAPTEAWVVGTTADPVAQTGTRVVHLATR